MSNYHEKYLKYKTKYLNLKIQLGGTIRNNMNHGQQRGGSLLEIILLILAQYGYFKPATDYEHVYKEMLKCEDYFNVLKNKFNTFVIQQIVNSNKHIQTAKSTLFQGIIVQRLAARCITDINEKLYTKAEYLQSIGECAAAVVLLDKAISYGHLPSRAFKAWMLINGRQGFDKNEHGAFALAKEGALLGCHHCQGVLAECYFDGHGCNEDTRLSLKLARDSSGKGSKYGQCILGQLYHLGVGGVAIDYAQALTFYRLAVVQNFDGAQHGLGHMYINGSGVREDTAEALRLWQLAAAQGHPEAMYCIADCHSRGRGVPENMAVAILWYRRAQAAGHSGAAVALFMLGLGEVE